MSILEIELTPDIARRLEEKAKQRRPGSKSICADNGDP